MAGILDYKQFLNTLKTTSDVGNIFPGDQRTWRFEVESTGNADGWTATIQWMTLIIDEVSYTSDGTPNFANSEPIGYYDGGSTSQFSTGVISIPKNMYTGKILPTSNRNVPVTVVNIRWTKDGENKGQNLVFIQNWEPGVVIGDPYIDSTPIIDESSTLTLENPGRQIYTDIWPFAATSNIPYNINNRLCYFFYDEPGGRVLLGTAPFIGKTATLNFDSDGSGLEDGIFEIYAEFGGVEEFGIIRSNTINLLVVPGIPLLVQSQTLTPGQSYYYPGDVPVYTLQVFPDPAFDNEGVAVNNDLIITLTDENVVEPLIADRLIADEAFNNGFIQKDVPITNDMVDSNVIFGETNFEVVSSITSGFTYTATVIVYNQHEIKTVWDFYKPGKYRKGETSLFFNAATLTNKTVVAEDFPITLSRNISSTIFTAPIDFTIRVNGRWTRPITLLAQPDAGGSPTTLASITPADFGNSVIYTATITTLGVGSWSIYATYPGDLGDTIFFANKASTSNVLTNQVVDAGQELDYRFFFRRDGLNDILTLWANSPIQLSREVTFFENSTVVGTSTFTGTSTAVFGVAPIETYNAVFPGSFSSSDSRKARVFNEYNLTPAAWNTTYNSMPPAMVCIPDSWWNFRTVDVYGNFGTYSGVRLTTLTGNYDEGHEGDIEHFYWTTATQFVDNNFNDNDITFAPEPITRGTQIFTDPSGAQYTEDRMVRLANGQDTGPTYNDIISILDPNCPIEGWRDYEDIPELTDTPVVPEGTDVYISNEFHPKWKVNLGTYVGQRYISVYTKFYNNAATGLGSDNTWSDPQPNEINNTFYCHTGKPPAPYKSLDSSGDQRVNGPSRVFLVHFYRYNRMNAFFDGTEPGIQVGPNQFPYRRNYFQTYGSQIANYGVNPLAADYYVLYGSKEWLARPIDPNQPYDKDQNNTSQFEYNFRDWVNRATYQSSRYQKFPTLTRFATTQTGVIFGEQIAQITLPLGSITDTDTIRAVWPGTADLPLEFGKYYAVDTSFTLPDTIITATNFLLPTVLASYDSTSTATVKDLEHFSNIWTLNQYKLKTNIASEYAAYLTPSALEGTVTFTNLSNGQELGTTSTVNGIATVIVTSTAISSLLTTNGVVETFNIQASFQSNPGAVVYTDSAITPLSISPLPPQGTVGGTYARIPFEYQNTLWEKEQFYTPDTAEFNIPQIGPYEFASFNHSDYSNTTTATVSIIANLDFIFPEIAWGGEFVQSTGTSNISVYGSKTETAFDVGFYYRVDDTGPYIPVDGGVFPFAQETISFSNGTWTFKNRIRAYVNSIYPGPSTVDYRHPSAKSCSLSFTPTNQTWDGPWTNIKFYFRAVGYYSSNWSLPFNRSSSPSAGSVAWVPPGASLAWKVVNPRIV